MLHEEYVRMCELENIRDEYNELCSKYDLAKLKIETLEKLNIKILDKCDEYQKFFEKECEISKNLIGANERLVTENRNLRDRIENLERVIHILEGKAIEAIEFIGKEV